MQLRASLKKIKISSIQFNDPSPSRHHSPTVATLLNHSTEDISNHLVGSDKSHIHTVPEPNRDTTPNHYLSPKVKSEAPSPSQVATSLLASEVYSIALTDRNNSYAEKTPVESEICEVPYERDPPENKEEQPSASASLPPPPPPYSPPVLSVYSMSMQQPQQRQGQSIITQVSAEPQAGFLDPALGQGLPFGNDIRLDLRGTVIELTRAELSQLPESILLGISNGLITDNVGNVMFSNNEVEVAKVNFSPECLQYTLDVFREATKEAKLASPSQSEATTPTSGSMVEEGAGSISELLRTKPAIIVLREDLDYYCLPNKPDMTMEEMIALKRECGKRLVEHGNIFTGLQRGEHSGSAEKHLIEMLCSSGFSPDEKWGFRALEPNKTVVSSLALVRLQPTAEESQETIQRPKENAALYKESVNASDSSKDVNQVTTYEQSISDDTATVGEVVSGSETCVVEEEPPLSTVGNASTLGMLSEHDENTPEESPGNEFSDSQAETDMARSHKLLLFWRKPARKCWWDHVYFDDIPNVDGRVKVHIRSVWTLELSVFEQ